MAIDPNAMYRAGLARGTTGRNPQVERRVARQQNLINFAYGLVGTVANEAIKDSFESLEKFRNLKESQTAAMNLTSKKIPEGNIIGPNGLDLKGSIAKINDEFRDLNREIRRTLSPKKRAQLKAERNAKQEELHYINSQLTIQQSKVPGSQGMAGVEIGTSAVDEQEGRVRYSPAAYGEQLKNVGEQANLDLGRLMWYDHDEKVLKVQRGGKWVDDKYVSLSPEENKELIKEHKAYEKDFETQQLDLPEEERAKSLSLEEWAKTQPNKTLRNPKYSELKFARKEVKTMTNDDLAVSKDFRKLGYTGNTLDFEGMKEETYNKIDDYTNAAFEDYFFGGPGYNYSTRTSSTESLAHKMLLSRNADTDFSGGPGVDDGDDTNNFIPPGSPANGRSKAQIAADDLLWQGAMTTLKVQDMSSGTDYRKFAQEKMWEKYKGLAEGSQARWKADNPQTTQLTFDQQIKLRNQQLDEQTRLDKLNKERQTGIDAQNTVYSIENEFSAGETTIGTGSRYAQKSEETTIENDDGTTTTVPAGWTLFVDGKVEKTIDFGAEDALDEITKHVTNTAGKYGTYELGSIKSGHMYIGEGNWVPPGEIKQFPLKMTWGIAQEGEDGKYYKANNGKTYYFTKKDGFKEIKE
tara:strand:- start:1768 stop:3672 length:1905 start_codon:yes stop_codon:yes gene_type:complete